MLLNKDKIAYALVGAEKRTMFYVDPEAYGERRKSRFQSIVDAKGHECGAVTSRYRLIRHGDLVAAADLASDKLGINLECGKVIYHRGRFSTDLYMPTDFNVPGDPSGIRPQITLGNSYGGTAALTGRAGVFRLICTNGTIIGQTIRADYQKHVGDFDVMKFVENLMLAVVCRAEEYQRVALQAAQTEANVEVVETLIRETTPKKYHATLHGAVESNVLTMGPTVWAIMQAISEVSTHDMKGLNATDWQIRHTNQVLAGAGILV